ncbi:HD domain-containing protein [Gorillibacterium timonense]|uniref:HD domain-containing protein n=1 Tax=Gorillibacterium timonense TaxID=1689269 RepID=UPI000A8BF9EE|nr:HD domain-containing protein [Gorillibacterium timonense]
MARLQEEKVFKDPVHRYIYVQDTLIWDLINSREFQRLRRIRQLGTSYLTFHGAEHSRFSHSLGVYEIVRRILSQFERSGFGDLSEEERLVCLCAALLHDVGHAPFSHSMEKIFGEHHEAWSCRIILGDTEIHQILSRVAEGFPEQVAGVICKTHPNPVAISLIASQLDADRMDYLLRDAYCTGVNYGTFDLDRILRVLRPLKSGVVVKESGMHAVEDYLMSRYQMYWQIYFHPVTRSAEIVLTKILNRAKTLYEDGYAFAFMVEPIRRLLEGKLSVEDYLRLDEALMQAAFSQWMEEKDPILADLCERFLNRRLFRYVPAEDISGFLFEQLRAELAAIGWDPDYYLEIDFPSDLPYDVYRPGQEDEKRPILLLGPDGELEEISRRSEIVRSISGIHSGQNQLYYPAELLQDKRLPDGVRKILVNGIRKS